MGRHFISSRGVGRYALVVGVTSLLLAGCTAGAATLSAVGVPSLSLSAPLTALACSTTGSCIALGASGGASGPTTAAQIRNHKGIWSALNVPQAPSASIDAASCAVSNCLVGGTRNSGDLLWSVNANNGATTALTGPAGGVVIQDLSCASDSECVAIDQAAHGLTRISHTTDAGRIWSAPRTLIWASNTNTVLDCTSVFQCYVATTSALHHVTLRKTLNSGITWTILSTPATWTSLSSLDCTVTCTTLVSNATGSSVATQSKLTWKLTPLKFIATSMSCATSVTCLVVGHLASQAAAMAQWKPGAVSNVPLTYVPTSLNSVACAPAVCVAVGVTTTVALRP